MKSNITQIKGKHNTGTVFTENTEDDTMEQIRLLCDQEFTQDSKIKIMPDVHIGGGCTIGTTMTIKDKVVPNLVGVDIGCGVEVVKLKNTHQISLEDLPCKKKVNLNRAKLSIGTLSGGNHFLEVNKDSKGNIYCEYS